MGLPLVVWDPRMLGYHHPGGHPTDPLRWVLTWLLAGSLGVVDGFEVVAPGPADVETLGMVHTLSYIDAVRRASATGFPFSVGHGLGTADDPIFPGMHDAAALIAGGSVGAARAIADGEVVLEARRSLDGRRLIRADLSPFRRKEPALRDGVNFALGKPDVPG